MGAHSALVILPVDLHLNEWELIRVLIGTGKFGGDSVRVIGDSRLGVALRTWDVS